MIVCRCLPHGENRGNAGVTPGKDLFPLVARSTRKHISQLVAQCAPAGAVSRVGKLLTPKPHEIEKFHEEALLNRSHGQISSIFRGIDPVERRTTIEDIRLTLVVPQSERSKTMNVCSEICRAVDHRDIHDLTPTRRSEE